MEPGAECLAGINSDDGVPKGGGVLAPWGAHDDATDAQNWKLGTPARRPLFGGDRSHEEWPDAPQAHATTREGGEAF